MTAYRVLVVEDEAITAKDLVVILEGLGYDVTAIARTGEEAVEKALEIKPDVVIMDIKLAGEMDGIEAADQINSRFHIPIIYLTAYTEDELLQRAKPTEPMGYVLKPFRPEGLRFQIELGIYKSQIDNRLRESEDRLQLALKGADLGFWDWNIETGVTSYSLRWSEMLGYPPDEIAPRIRFWEGIVHPDDAMKAKETLNQHLEGITDFYQAESRLRTTSGDYRSVLARGKVVERDGEGKPIRMAGTVMDITQRKRLEEEKSNLIVDLQKALAEIKTLSGLLPICAWCKKIRDDDGYWNEIEQYIGGHSEAKFSHGICPDCMRKLYPEHADEILGRLEKDEKK